jgi:hypothetical protein
MCYQARHGTQRTTTAIPDVHGSNEQVELLDDDLSQWLHALDGAPDPGVDFLGHQKLNMRLQITQRSLTGLTARLFVVHELELLYGLVERWEDPRANGKLFAGVA